MNTYLAGNFKTSNYVNAIVAAWLEVSCVATPSGNDSNYLTIFRDDSWVKMIPNAMYDSKLVIGSDLYEQDAGHTRFVTSVYVGRFKPNMSKSITVSISGGSKNYYGTMYLHIKKICEL